MTTGLGTRECKIKISAKAGYNSGQMDILFDGNKTPYNLKLRERILVNELLRPGKEI